MNQPGAGRVAGVYHCPERARTYRPVPGPVVNSLDQRGPMGQQGAGWVANPRAAWYEVIDTSLES